MAIFERIVTVYNDKGSKQAVKDLNKLEKQFKDAGKKIAKAFGVAALAAAGLAIKLGKDGVELASTLAAGGDAIRRIADEEIRASQIDLVNLDDIKSAHEAMDDLSDSVKGLSNAFASELAPSIVQATNALTTLINTGGKPAARGVMAGLSSFIVGAAGNAFSGGSAAAAAAARFMPSQQAELGNGGAIDQERITAARDAAELKAADARYKADSKRQEELADLEEKATKAEAERLKKNKEIAVSFSVLSSRWLVEVT